MSKRKNTYYITMKWTMSSITLQ